MHFVDQLKAAEKRTSRPGTYGSFIDYGFTTALRSACYGSAQHTVSGFYFMRSGYDNDTYGFTGDPQDPATHITSLAGADLPALEAEICAKLNGMGFRVSMVSASRHTEDRRAENGCGLFGVRKYKTVPTAYVQVYIDVAW